MTPQQQLQSRLMAVALPKKEIQVYGSQVVVTCFSQAAARQWADLIRHFAKIRGVVESFDYAAQNRNTVLRPTTVPVWRVFAVVQ